MTTLIHQLNSNDIAAKIRTAKQRVLYAAPGLDSLIASALISANKKLGRNQVSVVVDPDPMICRLGYGTIDDLQMLHEQGVHIAKENNLRLSFLISDNEGYVFTKPALLIETFEEGDRTPNAMKLNDQQIQSVVQATCPTLLEQGKKIIGKKSALEIGENSITEAEIDEAKKTLMLTRLKNMKLRGRCVFSMQNYFS